MVRRTNIVGFAVGIIAISGWAAAAWPMLSARSPQFIQNLAYSDQLPAGIAALVLASAALAVVAAILRNGARQRTTTQAARIGYLQDRLDQASCLTTELRGQIARLETTRSHLSPMTPEGFMSEIDREIIDGNIEREVALAERYVETHSEALLRAFNTLARAALTEDVVDEAQQERRRAIGLALVALAVYRGDEEAGELSRQLIPAAIEARDAA